MLEAVIFAGVSTLLYHLGMGFLLFLVPLQVVRMRKGRKFFFVSLGLAFVFILAIKLITAGRMLDAATAPFLLLEMFVVLVLIGGLVLIQAPELFPAVEFPPMRRVTRLVLATAAAGVVSIPLILYLRGNEAFNSGLSQVFDSLAAGLQRALGAAGANGAGGAEASAGAEAPPGGAGYVPLNPFALGGIALSGEALMAFVGRIFWRGFLFTYFLLVGFSWWLGSGLGARFRVRRPLEALSEASQERYNGTTAPQRYPERSWPRLVDFRPPDGYIWVLIGSLATVLLGLAVPLGPLELAAWNTGIVVLFLYGVSGVGVLQFFLRRFRVPRGMRWLLAFILCILAFSPRVNLAVYILVPGLGISEIWLRYRNKERSDG